MQGSLQVRGRRHKQQIGGSRQRKIDNQSVARADGSIDQQTLLVHGLAVAAEDRAAVAQRDWGLSYLPPSELRLQADGDFRAHLLHALASRINACMSIDAIAGRATSP